MKKVLDIMIDFETLSLASNAAVLQLAAVAFNRSTASADALFPQDLPPFEAKVDIRSCVADGFDFHPDSIKWWSEKPDAVKAEVLGGDCYPLTEVMSNFIDWLNEVQTTSQAEITCLWAQGADFDISILRTILRRYGMEKKFPISYRDFRDARTFIAEIGAHYAAGRDAMSDHNEIYAALPPYPQEGNVHSASYDCRRTAWALWQCMSLLPDA